MFCALVISEVSLRWLATEPTFGAAHEMYWLREGADTSIFTVSPEMGFRPILGNSLYNEWGTLATSYALEKPAGKTRVLFIGDSVTLRGRIVKALLKIHGGERFEYWNAGVESFNTVQEVALYRGYNTAIEPDHVVLTFHMNDLETTPVAFLDEAGQLVVYALHQPATRVNTWLFEKSYLYRAYLGLVRAPGGDGEAIREEVRGALRELADTLDHEGRRFSVIVFPYMLPVRQWSKPQLETHRQIIEMLEEEALRYFDLRPSLRRAIARRIDPQESPGDIWHPSDGVARVFAADLERWGLLESRDPSASEPAEPSP
jgi:hypothetical protein